MAVEDEEATKSHQKTPWRPFWIPTELELEPALQLALQLTAPEPPKHWAPWRASRQNAGPASLKHHGSEGRRSHQIAPKKLPNVPSEILEN